MKTVAVVPVRSGSKGLPGKNFRVLGGVPLWQRAVDQGAALADEVLVTTDAADILDMPAQPGVRTVKRPAELAQDDTPMAPVLTHLLTTELDSAATIILLQPTSPLRNLGDITAASDLFATGDWSMVMSVTEADRGVLKWGRVDGAAFRPLSDPGHSFTNRQSLPPVMRPNGAVYVFDRDRFLATRDFPSEKIGVHIMPPERSHDIDTGADFEKAEAMLAAQSSS